MASRKTIKRTEGPEARRPDSYRDQKSKIVQAAYKVIAERGFEGLRMREIARHAGLDHATLHYYFAGKEALINGVLDYIVQDLSIGRSRMESTQSATARKRLVAHFREHQRQTKEHPEMFIVLSEINARSMRDPEIRSLVARNDDKWKAFVKALLDAGLQAGEFRRDLDVDATATLILATLRGLSVISGNSARRLAAPLRQLEICLLAPKVERMSQRIRKSQD